jgi:hypothetical protein
MEALRPVSFEMIDDVSESRRYGFIAQELENVLPDLVVSLNTSATKAVLYQDLIAILTLVIQQQQEHIENLGIEIRNVSNTMYDMRKEVLLQLEHNARVRFDQEARFSALEKLLKKQNSQNEQVQLVELFQI